MKKVLYLLSSFFVYEESFAENITFLNSRETTYKNGIVTCSGNVIAIYNKKIISADEISFDEKNDLLKAKGNVIMKDEFENAYFADWLQVEQSFKSGCAINFKVIFSNQTRLAAKSCYIYNGEYLLQHAAFTSCYKCTESKALTWLLKAESVVFNPKNYTCYRNAVIEAYNIPILYTPYLSHVSSNLTRKSGFLRPRCSFASQVGLGLTVPYLFSISDSQELIVKPIFTSKIGHVPWFYYGWRFSHGEFNIDASLTGTKSIKKTGSDNKIEKIEKSGYRGHVFSKFRYELNNHWRTGFDIKLTSDRYYLKRFPFFENTSRTLESTVYLEGFDGRNYTMVRSSMFQSEYMDAAPMLLPMIEHSHYFPFFGGTLNFKTAFMNLSFKHKRMSQKYICNPSWYKEILLPGGHILETNAVLAMQGLKVSEKNKSNYNSYFQAMPQLTLTWKWPLVIGMPVHNFVFTPIIGISIAENKECFDAFENPFDEINILNAFFNNKSISPYNIDSGKRYFYGFHINGYSSTKNIYHISLGESFELTEPKSRLESTGIKYKRSNLVGTLDIFFNSNLTFSSSGSYSRKRNRFNQIETSLGYNKDKLSTSIMWFRGKQCFYNRFEDQNDGANILTGEKKYKGITFNAGYTINPRTRLKGEIVFGNSSDVTDSEDKRNGEKLKLLKYGIGLKFENECTKVFLRIERENKHGGDLRPDTTYGITVHLKNLG